MHRTLRYRKKLLSFRIRWFLFRLLAAILPDKYYIIWIYMKRLRKKPNLLNPQTFTEKMQWLKLNWRPNILTQCADKYEVRKFVESRVGPAILKELFGVYNRVEDINLDQLPNSFVLKVNHGCKQMVFCPNKADLNWTCSTDLLTQYLKANNYYRNREWAYKHIPPRIICEEHLTPKGETLLEYNFYCFNGIPHFVEITETKTNSKRVTFLDLAWNVVGRKYRAKALTDPLKPQELDQMVDYATRLSAGFPFVRVDLFYTNNRIYFGELTFYPLGGIFKFNPESIDLLLGSYLQIPSAI